MIKFSIFLALNVYFFLNFNAFGGDSSCTNTGQLDLGFENSEQWIALSHSLATNAAKTDLKGFCEWNRMDRSTGSLLAGTLLNPTPTQNIETYRKSKATGDRDTTAQLLLDAHGGKLSEDFVGQWDQSLMGNHVLKLAEQGSWFNKIKTCKTSSICHAKDLSKALQLPDLNGNYDVPTFFSKYPMNIGNSKLSAACVYVGGVLLSYECVSASKEVLKLVEPKVTDSPISPKVTGVSFITDCLSNPKITTALKNTASKLWAKIGSNSFGKNENIFTDLTSELKATGFSPVEARSEAIKVLGAIATGGPNFATRVKGMDLLGFPDTCKKPNSCNLNNVFMSAIAEGLSHADTLKMASDNPSPYSLPAGANFPCDSGKSYHFWLSAALTDNLVSKGYSAEAARAAVYTSSIGYQTQGTGRRDSDPLGLPRYGAVENGMRIDLNLAAAGGAFGSRTNDVEGKGSLDIKGGFIATMESGSDTAADAKGTRPLDGASNMWEWMARIAPKKTFQYYP